MSDTVQVPVGAQHPQILKRNFVWIMGEIVTWMIAFLENKNRKILVNMHEKQEVVLQTQMSGIKFDSYVFERDALCS